MGKSIINNVLPKKGKLRSVQKRPAAKISTTWKDVKYVREKCTVGPRGQRKDQIKWERTLHQLLRASDEEIINIQVNPEMGGHDLPYLLKRHLAEAAARSRRLPQASVQSSQLTRVDEPSPSTPTLHRRPRTASSVPPNAGRSYSPQVAQGSPEQDPSSSRYQP